MYSSSSSSSPPSVQTMQTIFLYFTILFVFHPTAIYSKYVIEPCVSSDSCSALLSYLLNSDLKLSEIASRFHIQPSQILASNSLDPSTPKTQIIPSHSQLKIPISCSCINGIRQSVSTTYTVQPIDTLDLISVGFGGLVSPDQIRSLNGIATSSQTLEIGTELRIPLPCTCFNNSDNGIPSVYLSYVVGDGDSLSSISAKYGSTEANLIRVNQLAVGEVRTGDILAVPIDACSSANMNLYSDSLLIPKGSYSLTAFNCIKCSCNSSDLKMYCSSFPLEISCHNLQCKGSNMFIGDVTESKMSKGCNVTTCLYRGYLGHTILSSLKRYIQPQCTGGQNHILDGLAPAPASNEPRNPFLPKSSSPISSPHFPFSPNATALGPISSSERPLCLILMSLLVVLIFDLFLLLHFCNSW